MSKEIVPIHYDVAQVLKDNNIPIELYKKIEKARKHNENSTIRYVLLNDLDTSVYAKGFVQVEVLGTLIATTIQTLGVKVQKKAKEDKVKISTEDNTSVGYYAYPRRWLCNTVATILLNSVLNQVKEKYEVPDGN